MREIKFRGKSKESGEWVYGYIVGNSTYPYILGDIIESDPEYINPEFWEPVDSETVGQYTGLHDKNDVEIYEGDIVEIMIPSGWNGSDIETHRGLVEYDQEDASFVFGNSKAIYSLNNLITVMGNVHENPELLDEGGQE